MGDVLILFIRLIVTAVRVMRPGGIRSVVAESILLRHQLLVFNRLRYRAPYLRLIDRVVAGLCAGLLRPARRLVVLGVLFEFNRRKTNLGILDIEKIKTVPYVRMSHPFVEPLIGTIRLEYLDHVPFRDTRDLGCHGLYHLPIAA